MNDGLTRDSYPSNSKLVKKEEVKVEDKKVEKVISGIARKKKRSFGKKLAETFLEDDTKTVGSYVVHDVLIPAAKSMICDIVGWGGFAEMMLFGGKKGSRTTRDRGKSITNYSNVSYRQSESRDRDTPRSREVSKTSRARHDFDEIILETRGEAEQVLSHLVDLVVDYDEATVADFYDLVGITTEFTDNKYGWTDLRNVAVSRVRGGYVINLPRTQPLD